MEFPNKHNAVPFYIQALTKSIQKPLHMFEKLCLQMDFWNRGMNSPRYGKTDVKRLVIFLAS